MKFFNYFTTFLIVLGAYFANQMDLGHIIFEKGTFNLRVSDLFIFGALICLFFEVVKSSIGSVGNVYESMLSMFVSIAFLLLFILLPLAHTSTFLILTVMSFFDSIAGFIITANAARRDIGMASHPL